VKEERCSAESSRNGTAMERPSHLARAASSSDTDFENGNSVEGK
jgi:hypothetical protein